MRKTRMKPRRVCRYNKRLLLRIDEETYNAIMQLKEYTEVPISSVVRYMLNKYIKEYAKQ